MKFSEKWLRSWVSPKIDTAKLVEQLTMLGLEVDAVTPVGIDITKVAVGEVLSITPHPNADRLRICLVNIGKQDKLQIVCGASNVREGLKVAVAEIGATLSCGLQIQKAKLRGVESQGMICSAAELGLEDKSEGIMELPTDAPVGKDFCDYYDLQDNVIEIAITPNRGDCLSIAGVAREVAALNNCSLTLQQQVIPQVDNTTFPIKIAAKQACPRYTGRVVRNINTQAKTPLWMAKRLRLCGMKSISTIVDITNYVMLELGQPLHAFDLHKLNNYIEVRYSANESLELLDGQKINLDSETLVIADSNRVLAMAGIMGGLDSAVDANTKDIFLESAFFDPHKIVNYARKYRLRTESSHRFERGVDFAGQARAIERATELLIEIAAGTPGPVTESASIKYLPKSPLIKLRNKEITRVLGIEIPKREVISIMKRLSMQQLNETPDGWNVIPPSYRFDINLEIDLIEEIARVYGYSNFPAIMPQTILTTKPFPEIELTDKRIRSFFIDKGYHETMTYSFGDPKMQSLLFPDVKQLSLNNPIAADMSVMRASLWPGLIQVMLHNMQRQQERIRLFEMGLCFGQDKKLQQISKLAGLATGFYYPEQWGAPNRKTDFFDLKGELEALFALSGNHDIRFVDQKYPALHPGKSAAIYEQDKIIGRFGILHPGIKQKLYLREEVCLFEIDLSFVNKVLLPQFREVSKYPSSKRDIAIIVAEEISAEQLMKYILKTANSLLQDVQVFDIYRGSEIGPRKKSVALRLFLQHHSRTLVEREIDAIVDKIVKQLRKEFAIELRR